jgi:hypothetical protein
MRSPPPWSFKTCTDCSSIVFDAIGRGLTLSHLSEDDARLIAAAPDLLTMAKEALTRLGEDGWTEKEPLVKRLRAAIAKATGEPQ